jgi:hypothetical protein
VVDASEPGRNGAFEERDVEAREEIGAAGRASGANELV